MLKNFVTSTRIAAVLAAGFMTIAATNAASAHGSGGHGGGFHGGGFHGGGFHGGGFRRFHNDHIIARGWGWNRWHRGRFAHGYGYGYFGGYYPYSGYACVPGTTFIGYYDGLRHICQ